MKRRTAATTTTPTITPIVTVLPVGTSTSTFVQVDQSKLDEWHFLQHSDNGGSTWNYTLVAINAEQKVPFAFEPSTTGGKSYSEPTVPNRIYRLIRGGQQ